MSDEKREPWTDGDLLELLGHATAFDFGKVAVVRMREGWAVRTFMGPSWFWNFVSKKWEISIHLGDRVGWDKCTTSDLRTAVETARSVPELK